MRHPARFFVLLFLFGLFPLFARAADPPALQELIHQAQARHLADARYWRLLLHYHKTVLGCTRSDIDDPHFFFSPCGGTDPEAELEATLRAFFAPVPSNPDQQPAACAFPARYAWLNDQLHFGANVPTPPCPRFEQWRSQLNPASVTLVFASYYMNNPSSMYGHTFLRLDQKNHSEQGQLLDYTVNFAADVTTYNGLLYAWYGLTGGYRGHFSTLPYYMKVQEYNNMESRDLWEYALTLTPAEIDRMMRHLWEMGNASFAYYFLIRNCSYQLLTLLEAARPDLFLTEPFRFKAIPVDTLRAVLRPPGLVSEVSWRPSHVHKMLDGRSRLSRDEIPIAEALARNAGPPALARLQSLPRDRQALVLDSAYNYFRYRVGFLRDQPAAVQDQDQRLLAARSRLSDVPVPPSDARPVAIRPDEGHATGRVGLAYGFNNHSHFEEFAMRPALHDLGDETSGYIPGSQLQMFDLRLRYDNDRRTAFLHDFTLIDLISLSPLDRWVRVPSWKVKTGLATADDLSKDPENSLYYGLNTGPGLTVGRGGAMAYAFAETDAGVGRVFDHSGRWGGGGSTGVLFDLGAHWTTRVEVSYLYYFLGDDHAAVKWQCVQAFPLTPDWQLRATLQRQNQYKEVLLSLFRYL